MNVFNWLLPMRQPIIIGNEAAHSPGFHSVQVDRHCNSLFIRGQVYRCLGKWDLAWQDMEHAIQYGPAQPAVLKQAYAQRAILRRSHPEPKEASKERILQDFTLAAQYGNPLAAQYVKQNNPYAALCNAMLQQVLPRKLPPPPSPPSAP